MKPRDIDRIGYLPVSLAVYATAHHLRPWLASLVLAYIAALPTWADVTGAKPVTSCAALAERTVHEYTILSADRLEAAGEIPERCRVLGVLPPEIVFEVVLPAEWNGRILMRGNGGYAGTSPNVPSRVRGSERTVADGFVSVYTNTGHDRAAEPLATFALNNRQKEIDYSFRAVRLTIQTAKELVSIYYGQPPNYTYWTGCSTGGRQGLMAAQRFPKDFDGILVGAPVLDFTGTQIWGAWNAMALADAPLTLSQMEGVAKAVYAKCDGLDGLEDGLLEDPRACDFDPERDLPRCNSAATDQCFSDGQIEALAKIYGGVISQGAQVFPGLPVGSEAAPPSGRRRTSGWQGWIVDESGPSRQHIFAETFMRYLAFEPDEPEFELSEFDFDEDPGRMGFIRSILDATDPDLTRFRDAGGKMLMYFGWADTALNPMMGVNYYEDALRVTGPETRDFFRLFMVPGMFHCSGGLGVSQTDYFESLMQWVEAGKVPERLEASRVVGGQTELTRPLCPYPEVAVYDGTGDQAESASFSCAPPDAR